MTRSPASVAVRRHPATVSAGTEGSRPAYAARLSNDLYILAAGDPAPIMQKDVRALAAAGFTVEETRSLHNA